jgi:phage shock protein PspC (stress-responsive transcriptional regulator)
MTITDEHPPIETPPEEPRPVGPGGPDVLRRSTSKRLVAGVAGGISERFDIDVTIVRVAFVVAACFWGLGAVIYLAMWALVPPDKEAERPEGADPEERAGTSWMTYVLLTGALVLGLILSSVWWGGPRWGGGLGLGWVLVLFGVVVVALRRPTRVPTLGRILLVLALIVISLVILATGAFFGAVATTGVPLTGGIGQRIVQPTSPAQLQTTYRLAIGNMTVDLTRVPFGSAPRTVTASVGVGVLVIDVPPGAVVDVRAQSSIGSVSYGDSGQASFETPTGPTTIFGAPRPQLVVDARVGIGQVRLERGGS